MSEHPDPPQDPTARYALGILFVHGIGVQRRGETLVEFGEPIYRWLEAACEIVQNRWLYHSTVSRQSVRDLYDELAAREKADGGGSEALGWALEAVQSLLHKIAVRRHATPPADEWAVSQERHQVVRGSRFHDLIALGVALNYGSEGSDSPAHAELVIRRLRWDGSLSEERWLLSESCWAETFAPPSFLDLARWGLGIVPWTIGSHFGVRLRRVWLERPEIATARHRARWMARLSAAVLRLLGSIPLSFVALSILAVLLLFAALPIPRLRAALGGLQRRIASSLGDSYILLSSPIEAAAIVGQVGRDLGWLAEPSRCRSVAAVAHSQGAAVVQEALRKPQPASLRLLLTFGSGLRKLEELRQLLASGNRLRDSAGMTLAGVVLAGLLLWVVTLAPSSLFSLGLLVFSATALIVAGLRDLTAGVDLADLRWRIRRLAASGIRWVDYHAESDPVPNGRILDPPEHVTSAGGIREEFPESVVVHNEDSVSRDHTAYWKNLDEFVGSAVARLAQAAGWEASYLGFGEDLSIVSKVQEAIVERRRWRVRRLAVLWWTTVLAVVITILSDVPLFMQAARWAAQEWFGASKEPPPWVAGFRLGSVLLAFLAGRWFWDRWNNTEMTRLLRWRKCKGLPSTLFWAAAIQVLVVGVAVLTALLPVSGPGLKHAVVISIPVAILFLYEVLTRAEPSPEPGVPLTFLSTEEHGSRASEMADAIMKSIGGGLWLAVAFLLIQGGWLLLGKLGSILPAGGRWSALGLLGLLGALFVVWRRRQLARRQRE